MSDAFQFRVNLQELLDAETLLTKAIGSKKVKPILQMIRVEVRKDHLVLRAFNNFLQIETIIPAVNEGLQVHFCVPAFMFTVLSQYKNKKGTVDIKQMEKGGRLLGKLLVSQELRSNEFSFVSVEQYPDKIQLDNYQAIDLGKFLEAVNLTKVGAADLLRKPALRCLHLDGERIMSGDGTQFAKYEGVEIANVTEIILIRAKLLLENIKLLNEIALSEYPEIAFSADWLGFRSQKAGKEIVFQKYAGEPMDYLKIYSVVEETEPVCVVKLNLAELMSVLNLAIVYEAEAISSAYPSYINISFGQQTKFTIRIEDVSSNEESLDSIEFTGSEITIQTLASKLRQMIAELRGETVTFKIYSKQDPFQVIADDMPQFIYLQAP